MCFVLPKQDINLEIAGYTRYKLKKHLQTRYGDWVRFVRAGQTRYKLGQTRCSLLILTNFVIDSQMILNLKQF